MTRSFSTAKFLLMILLTVSIVQVGVLAGYKMSATPQHKTIDITAQQFKFTPSILTVNKGDTIVLHLTSMDVTHGFYLDGYGINVVINPFKTTTVTFVANKVGKFTFRCSHTCGNFHPYMLGELRVQPNVTFYAGIILVGLVSLTMIIGVYKKSKELGSMDLEGLEVNN